MSGQTVSVSDAVEKATRTITERIAVLEESGPSTTPFFYAATAPHFATVGLQLTRARHTKLGIMSQLGKA